jgi:flavoprotein
MAMASLAGMFTDKTTMKLKDILDTIISPKDVRTDKLTGDTAFKVNDINPKMLQVDKVNNIVISGTALTSKKLVIKINDTAITNAVITDTAITIPYTIEPSSPPQTEFKLVFTDDKGAPLYSFNLEMAL